MPSSISSSSAAEGSEAAPMRLTASDRPGVAQPVPERPVPVQPWGGMLVAATLLALLFLGGWEWYWRDHGVLPSYRDDSGLWSIQRRRIDATGQNSTVIVASSRSFFDIQLP